MKPLYARLILTGCLLLSAMEVSAEEPAEQKPKATPAPQEQETPKQTQLTISQETTHIVEPLKENGYVDYIAALNDISSEGVTPENNAAVLLAKVLGPKAIPESIRQQYYEALGIEPLPEEGDYWMETGEFFTQEIEAPEQRAEALEKVDPAYSRPWSPDEFPLMAKWLKENEKALDLVVQAVQREKYYDPLISPSDDGEEGMLIAVLLPTIQAHRDLARGLLARAMLSVQQEDAEAAMRDLLAAHRLGRFSGSGPTLIHGLVGIAIDVITVRGDVALAHSGLLTREQSKQYRQQLDTLPPLPKMATKIDIGERFMFLDALEYLSRGQVNQLGDLTGSSGFNELVGSWVAKHSIDWDLIARLGNDWYDRLRDAASKPTLAEREQALAEYEEELKMITQTYRDPTQVLKKMVLSFSPRKVVSESVGNVLMSLLLPAVTQVVIAEERAEANLEMAQLALLLGEYRKEKGQYPEELSALTPEFTKQLPIDNFSEKPYHYEKTAEGFKLYSVGANRKDDKGRSWGDNPQGDDLTLKTPLKAE